ncbi:MAG: alpha/beta fold hydrolase [Thermoleophilaceae bacterium]
MGLSYDRGGSGEPLLLLHPLGGDRQVWRPVWERLTAERDVIAVDMPGFGESGLLPGGAAPTPEALARAIAGFAAGLGVERPHVAGISLGAWVALELAKAGGASSVAALCPAGFWREPLGPRPERARTAARVLLPALRPLLATRRGRRAALSGAVAHPERVPADAAYALVRAYAKAPGFVDANLAMRNGVFSGLDGISAPVTLAWGEHDRLVTRPRRDPTGVRTVVLVDCGHVPTYDDPEQVARVVLEATGA